MGRVIRPGNKIRHLCPLNFRCAKNQQMAPGDKLQWKVEVNGDARQDSPWFLVSKNGYESAPPVATHLVSGFPCIRCEPHRLSKHMRTSRRTRKPTDGVHTPGWLQAVSPGRGTLDMFRVFVHYGPQYVPYHAPRTVLEKCTWYQSPSLAQTPSTKNPRKVRIYI